MARLQDFRVQSSNKGKHDEDSTACGEVSPNRVHVRKDQSGLYSRERSPITGRWEKVVDRARNLLCDSPYDLVDRNGQLHFGFQAGQHYLCPDCRQPYRGDGYDLCNSCSAWFTEKCSERASITERIRRLFG